MNVIERLNWIEKSSNVRCNTKRISRKKLKIWNGQDHSALWWLSVKGNAIAVYEAGFKKVTNEVMLKVVERTKDLKYIKVLKQPDFNLEECFEEFRWLIDKTIHELTWSEEYPKYLESWRPLAKESLRTAEDDAIFVASIKDFLDIIARRH